MTHEVVVGLGFGDEGKGSTVDWLCATRDIRAVIRYNGGPQAAHNVVQPDGRHHTFAQFGSGSFHRVPTHLSEYMLVNPFNIMKEDKHLRSLGVKMLHEMTIAEGALLVTPYHVAANRTRETIRGRSRHGSTGQGIGETQAFAESDPDYAPRVGDLLRPHRLERKLNYLLEALKNELPLPDDLASPDKLVDQYVHLMGDEVFNVVPDNFIDRLLDAGDCVFEGAQGVLLDRNFGFFPHVTRAVTTTENAMRLLAGRKSHTIGVTRTYHTRHGAGPFPTEDYETGILHLPEPHNGTGEYQGSWRVGALDLTLLEYACRAVRDIDTIMVTHMDRLDQSIMATHGYEDYSTSTPFMLERLRLPIDIHEQQNMTCYFDRNYLVPQQYDLLDNQEDVTSAIENITGIRPTMFSWGPTHEDKMDVGVSFIR